MSLLLLLILGIIAGWLASMLAGSNHSQGVIGDMIVGVIGSFIGGFTVSMLGGEGITGFNIYSILVATLGAVILLAAKRAFMRA